MTYQEIYDRIVYKLWPDSTVPSQTVNVLTGEYGMINTAHQAVQLEHNWWFQESFGVINTIAGQQSYSLFDDFKEIRSCLFKVLGKTYFTRPLYPLFKPAGEAFNWQSDVTVEYPDMFEIADAAIVVYPAPTFDDRELHIIYWKMFAKLVDMADEDPVTKFAHDMIIEKVCAEMCDARKEFDDSSVHRQRYAEAYENLLKRHNARVSNYIKQVGVGL